MVQHVQRVRDMLLEQRINANAGDFARLDTLRQQFAEHRELAHGAGRDGG
jgi:hypothetical protein